MLNLLKKLLKHKGHFQNGLNTNSNAMVLFRIIINFKYQFLLDRAALTLDKLKTYPMYSFYYLKFDILDTHKHLFPFVRR